MNLTTGLMLGVVAVLSPDYQEIGVKRKHEKKGKPCLNCGNFHTHNNSFCSAECCKEHRK